MSHLTRRTGWLRRTRRATGQLKMYASSYLTALTHLLHRLELDRDGHRHRRPLQGRSSRTHRTCGSSRTWRTEGSERSGCRHRDRGRRKDDRCRGTRTQGGARCTGGSHDNGRRRRGPCRARTQIEGRSRGATHGTLGLGEHRNGSWRSRCGETLKYGASSIEYAEELRV